LRKIDAGLPKKIPDITVYHYRNFSIRSPLVRQLRFRPVLHYELSLNSDYVCSQQVSKIPGKRRVTVNLTAAESRRLCVFPVPERTLNADCAKAEIDATADESLPFV
jgi:hypothetical protein